jgi:glycosyltransferase involved in cell wall biosynthesis
MSLTQAKKRGADRPSDGADKELWLFTEYYPFGWSESFLENELPILVRRFGRVRVFPLFRREGERDLPSGAERQVVIEDPYAVADLPLLLRHALSVVRLLRSLWSDLGFAMFRREWRYELLSRMRQMIRRVDDMERSLMAEYDPERVVLYSYWTNDWATQLALLKARDARLRFVSRAHGFDLYEHQHQRGAIPFRRLQLKSVDALFCVSQAGLDHMRTRHPQFTGKYEHARLGTSDHGVAQASSDNVLRVVSCGYVIPRKRFWLIADALALARSPVHWTHFGDGPEMPMVRERLARLPGHVQVDLRGETTNADIMAWYASNPVDVHVLTSRLEGGVAVALQEAASFGVPLIATDSGGVRDLVTSATGILLPTTTTPEDLMAAIARVPQGPLSTPEFRAGVRAYWEANFMADTAFDAFCDRLLDLCRKEVRRA